MNSKGRPMKRRSPLPYQTVKTINELYGQGKTMREIGNLIGISHWIIRYYIDNPRSNGPRPKHKEVNNDEDSNQMQGMWDKATDKGNSQSNMAALHAASSLPVWREMGHCDPIERHAGAREMTKTNKKYTSPSAYLTDQGESTDKATAIKKLKKFKIDDVETFYNNWRQKYLRG